MSVISLGRQATDFNRDWNFMYVMFCAFVFFFRFIPNVIVDRVNGFSPNVSQKPLLSEIEATANKKTVCIPNIAWILITMFVHMVWGMFYILYLITKLLHDVISKTCSAHHCVLIQLTTFNDHYYSTSITISSALARQILRSTLHFIIANGSLRIFCLCHFSLIIVISIQMPNIFNHWNDLFEQFHIIAIDLFILWTMNRHFNKIMNVYLHGFSSYCISNALNSIHIFTASIHWIQIFKSTMISIWFWYKICMIEKYASNQGCCAFAFKF